MAVKVITQVIDRETKLELYISATDNVLIDKASVKLRLDDPYVYLYDNSMSDQVNNRGTVRVYTLNFASITAPVTANAAALETAILAMLNTSSGADIIAELEAIEVLLTDILAADEAIQAVLENNFDVTLGSRASEATLLSVDGTLDTILAELQFLSTDIIDFNDFPESYESTAYESDQVIKASNGVLIGITGYNASASDQFIQVFDSTTVPADTAVPTIMFIARAQSNFYYDPGNRGMVFSTGIAISNSSTGPTKTIGAADCWFNVLYR